MENSILLTIKKLLGLCEDYDAFDMDIIIHINMVFNILNQMGVGPKDGFIITGPENVWEEYVKDSRKLEMVKTYIYLKVRQIFDPGTSTPLNNAIEAQISELEWRLSVQVDPGDEEE